MRPDDELQFIALDYNCIGDDYPEFARLPHPLGCIPEEIEPIDAVDLNRVDVVDIVDSPSTRKRKKVTGYRLFMNDRLDRMSYSKTHKRWSMNKRVTYIREMWNNLSKAQKMKYEKK